MATNNFERLETAVNWNYGSRNGRTQQQGCLFRVGSYSTLALCHCNILANLFISSVRNTDTVIVDCMVTAEMNGGTHMPFEIGLLRYLNQYC